MIDDTNRMEVTRKAIKHIYMARIMMRMVCHSTGCSRCPFHNADAPPRHSCFFAQLEDVRRGFPTLTNMLLSWRTYPNIPNQSRRLEMTKQDKQDLVSILTTMEGICKRHYPNHNGCPFYNRVFRGCSFYSILDNGFKVHHIDLVKLKLKEMNNANKTVR